MCMLNHMAQCKTLKKNYLIFVELVYKWMLRTFENTFNLIRITCYESEKFYKINLWKELKV
jgi:hypothetical protein